MPEAPVPTARYESYSHEAMAAEVERGNDPAAAGETGARWDGLAKLLQESTAGLAALVVSSEESWRGEAGDAARAALDRATRWLSHSAAVSASVGRAVGAQAEVAARARADMPPPVTYDPAAMIRDAASSGNLLVLAGLANREIARQLGLATRTVELRLTHTYRKLGVKGRAALVAHLRARQEDG